MSVKVETLEKEYMAKLTIKVLTAEGGEGYAGSLLRTKE